MMKRLLLLAMSMMLCMQLLVVATENQEISMHIGSANVLENQKMVSLDKEKKSLAPVLIQGKTFVPLRFIAQTFGAQISYEKEKNEAIVLFGDKKAIFPIGKSYFILNNNKIELNIVTFTRDGRTFVPLRMICEKVFGKNVSYFNEVIYIGDTERDISKDKDYISSVKQKLATVIQPSSYQQLKNLFKASGTTDNTNGSPDLGKGEAAAEDSAQAPTADKQNSSTTNIQVQGVDEADVIKTDGSYIYTTTTTGFLVLDKDLQEIARVNLPDNTGVHDMYLDKDRLTIIASSYSNRIYPTIMEEKMQIMPQKSFVSVFVYDLSNIKTPKLLKTYEIEGYMLQTRKIGDILYTVTNHYVNMYEDNILPIYKNNADTKNIALEDTMYINGSIPTGFTVISAINTRDLTENKVKAIATSAHNIYMSNQALYLISSEYQMDKSYTRISRFDIDKMNISFGASGMVNGYILNQFSVDEYEGNLRIATTEWNAGNNLYILDENLTITGEITNLANGERIYSVRFMGDTGYVVTFKNIDPLFVMDLSNPSMPKVTGELKIPGFSNYLHPVGENLLLGIGQDVADIYMKDRQTGKEIVIGTQPAGIKLSLFNVSNKQKPIEQDVFYIGGMNSYAEVFYNHKALMVRDNMFAFEAYLSDNQIYGTNGLVFEITDKINLKAKLPADIENYGEMLIPNRRFCAIDDTVYYMKNNTVTAYSAQDFSKLNEIIIKK